MSGLRRDWLAGTTLEKPRTGQEREAGAEGAVESADVYEQIAALAEHLEKEVKERKAIQAQLARQNALHEEITSSFAVLQEETEARIAVERDARLALGAQYLYCSAIDVWADIAWYAALWRLSMQNTS